MKHRQQQQKSAKKERVHSPFLLKVIILILLAGSGFQLWRLSGQVFNARQTQADLTEQVDQIQQENHALTEDITEGPTVEKMKEIARNELGYVDPGEYVFEIIGAG